jgi:anti-sigma factor RsiW
MSTMSSHTPVPIDEADLHAYVDNALDAARRKEVQDYIDRNPQAAQAVAALSGQRQLLRSALSSIADEPIPQRLSLSNLIRERRQQRRWPWQMAAAVFLSLGIGAVGGLSLRDRTAPAGGISALAGEARASYAVYATDNLHPVEMGPQQRAELLSWVSSKLNQPVTVPDLTPSGYRFSGGRVVATEHGPAAMFLYEAADGTRLAVVMRRMAHETDTPMLQHSDGHVGGYAWAVRGLGFSLVGTGRPEALHPLADEVRRQVQPTPSTGANPRSRAMQRVALLE